MIIRFKGLLAYTLPLVLAAGVACKSSDDDDDDSGSSGTVSASTGTTTITDLSEFDLSSSLSLVSAKTTTATSLVAIDETAFAATSDYMKDATSLYVHDPAFEPLDSVNEILCTIDQLAIGEKAKALFTAAGETYPFEAKYIAQVDESQCSSKGSSDSNSNSSGSSKSTNEFYIKVMRETGSSPLVVQAWFDDEEGMGGATRIGLELAILESSAGSAAKNSFGVFEMNFVQFALTDAGDVGEPTMRGLLHTKQESDSKLLVRFLMEGGGEGMTMGMKAAASLDIADKEVTGGVAQTASLFEGPEGQEGGSFKLAFDENYFVRYEVGIDGTEKDGVCLDQNSFAISAWRYGVYDNAGKRYAMNGGFPMSFKDSAGKEKHGFVGYWGIFAGPNDTVANGTTITKKDHSTGTTTDYTVISAPGKLMKHTKRTLTTAELKGIPLRTFTSEGEKRIEYDGSAFKVTGKWKQSSMGGDWEAASGTFTLSEGRNNFHSEQLGGSVEIIYESSAIKAIVYFEEELASNLTTVPTKLNCLIDCLKPDITAAMMTVGRFARDGTGYYHQEDSLTNGQPNGTKLISKASPIVYTWKPTEMALVDSAGKAIGVKSGEKMAGSETWGLRSGALVDDATLAKITNPWDVFNQDVYYTWETGTNSWNKFAAVKASDGTLVKFDRPRFFLYNHKKENDAVGPDSSEYYDKKYLLSYEGFGQLHGFPNVNAGEGERQHWAPAFSLKNGVEVTDTATSTEYVVKMLDAEQRMTITDGNNCVNLDVSGAPDYPTITGEWKDITADVKTMPDFSAETISVIEGVLQ